MTADLVSGPSNALEFDLAQDGTFSYTPSQDFFGTDSFSYEITDSAGNTSTAEVNIIVSPVNDIPVAVAESFTFETGVIDAVLDVMANDVDADQDAIVAVILSQPENGQIVMLADGNLGYTPDPGFIGTDQFTYAPSDFQTQGTLVTVELIVDAPGGVPAEGVPAGINNQSLDLQDTNSNDSDGDSAVSYTHLTLPTIRLV